jgi:hypothetical protein
MASSTSYVDVAGLIDVQKKYLANLRTNANEPSIVAAEIVDINNNIDNIGVALSHNSSAYILSGQKSVYDIVHREQERLNSKKESVETASQGQNRLIELNTNYKKRYNAYTNIIIIGIVTLVLFIIILFLRTIMIIPPIFLNVSTIIIFTTSTLMCGRIFVDINTRDSIYYDKLDTNSAFMKKPASILADISNNKAGNNGVNGNFNNLTFNTGFCYGASCCSGNTFWDSINDVCVPRISCGSNSKYDINTNTCIPNVDAGVSAMTTLEMAYNSGDIGITNKQVSSYSPSEFSEYGRI